MPPETYVAAEPSEVKAFVDQSGQLFHSRETAIQSNFRHDLRLKVEECLMRHERNLDAAEVMAFLRNFASDEPDMLRILVGDRDET